MSDVTPEEVPGWKILMDGSSVVDLNEGAGGLYSNIIYKTG